MLIVLLYIATATLLAVALLFKDKLLATGWASILIGIGYFVWGIIGTFNVPDSLVDSNEPMKMWLGIGLTMVGLLLLALGWLLAIRRAIARR